MIIQLEPQIAAGTLAHINEQVGLLGYKATEVQTQQAHYLVAIGKEEFDIRAVGHLDGVRDVHRVSDPYKLVSKKWAPPGSISATASRWAAAAWP